MPPKRWIDKNKAQTYQLLYRPQDDPELYNETAGDRTLYPVSGPASSSRTPAQDTGLHLKDLEDDLDFDGVRPNEGEAAEYGVYYDDTSYDYMQHLRDIGQGGGESHYVEAIPQGKGKGKAKTMKLEDALREVSLDDDRSVAESEMLSTFSTSTRPRTYQDQQDVPDDIAGFQPDMDPRLREVLEALDDDAYVDENDEEDLFGALANEGRYGELDLAEFEANFVDEDDEGWESDATEKAPEQPAQSKMSSFAPMAAGTEPRNEDASLDAEAAAAEDGDWLKEFAKFKRDHTKKVQPRTAGSIIAASAAPDQAPSLYTLNGTPLRQKKRKGALTNPSAYSMTSSSLARTDGQQLLDARFDQVEKMYSLDEADEGDDMDGGMSLASGMTGRSKMSQMSQLSTTSFADEGAVRGDWGGMMDDFLGDWNKANPGGKRRGAKGKRGKNGNEKYGLQQLEEVRAELGPARIHRRTTEA
ncbi:Protein ltv1 [Exophiala xenobiotica]|uniref:Protein ltv1 n=1 Tax=Vermiconidia calcicola TaxID=1690605 RepID=A0AAV9QFQ2_9PEZI|nr:Protein ltv1 [Exophiala xenobiotica]KAK5542478.1 Protein ltv1 [Vermiconidia calcicola]KAK5546336.1 Protein ltv1 [Chaetothyriales sp. CCFEE 6169]KAK5279650.1 Protein ltv1 [Exophiala xenobiotica]KAK5306491.1 Protein ltv1 [Exophiala xenobiotica]